jgi:hypothetical protein
MTQKIPCFCDNSFTVEIPPEINLDSSPAYISEIINGSFLNFTCSSCGKKHKPEFSIKILWPSKKVWFDVIIELDRRKFYRQKKEGPYRLFHTKGTENKETIIGYPELSDRIMVYHDGLEPVAVEAIKYFLHLKAEEDYPGKEINVWYSGLNFKKSSQRAGVEINIPNSAQGESLDFHIHGIKEDEVALMKIPFSLYEKNLRDYKKHPRAKIYRALRVLSYLSVKNMMRQKD